MEAIEYWKHQTAFLEFVNKHKYNFVQKNRQSGFTTVLEKIVEDALLENKKVLFICANEESGHIFKKYNIDLLFGKHFNPFKIIEKRYDLIIVDECGFVFDNFEKVYSSIIEVLSDDGRLIVSTTPVKKCNVNYIFLKEKLFKDAAIDGNLFHFNDISHKLELRPLGNWVSIFGNDESVINEIFGEFC